MDTIEQEIERLRRDIEQYNHEYYVLNSPTVSDKEYDMLMKKLEQLELQHPEYDDPLSPSHRVGSDLTKGFEQWPHERRMLSPLTVLIPSCRCPSRLLPPRRPSGYALPP